MLYSTYTDTFAWCIIITILVLTRSLSSLEQEYKFLYRARLGTLLEVSIFVYIFGWFKGLGWYGRQTRLTVPNVEYVFKGTISTCSERQSHCGERGWSSQGLVPSLSLSHSVPYLSTLLQKEKGIQNNSDSFFLQFNISSVECNHFAFGT